MASNYNMLPKPAVVFVKDKAARLVVRRQTYEDLLSNEVFRPQTKSISLVTLKVCTKHTFSFSYKWYNIVRRKTTERKAANMGHF